MNRSRSAVNVIIGLIVALSIGISGCSVSFDPIGDTPSDNGAPNNTPDPSDFVTVHLRNLTQTEAVDVEFYLTTDLLAVVPEDLFVETYRIRGGIGVAGTGIIVPLTEDVVEFPCVPGLLMGTAGGMFLDNESGELRGIGMPRWVAEEALGYCGGTVSFDFVPIGDGTFDTVVQIID